MRFRSARGFTLIELLIVVAIIAILAAIAVPNFLEAQTRAKVSRVLADMRSLVTAIEAYVIDYNQYPPNDGRFYSTPIEVTTPVAFITSRPIDPFAINMEIAADLGLPQYSDEDQFFSYWRIVSFGEGALDPVRNASPLVIDFDSGGNRNAFEKYGRWCQGSVGPDGAFADLAAGDASITGLLGTPGFPPWGYSFDIPYDPTNGTVSFGNISRTQINQEGQNPDPDLL
jgi:prepilin-type N-terminal cleavage/methylation domain-containing protein